jgi:2,3-dihydroxy-p-cumate/2,3-dihydroxybenzoate 3,4-dioxygenase
MIELTDIAYVRSSTPDLEESVRFATEIVGLEVSGTEDGVIYLRADDRHHRLSLVEGPPGVLAIALCLASADDLRRAEQDLHTAEFDVARGSADEARARRVAEFIAFDDPAGNRIELVVDPAVLGRPVNFTRDAGITECGHFCLDAQDTREAAKFWTTMFSARVSDHIGDAAYLLRIDPVHHKLAIFANDRPGLCHINFQVDSLDSLMRNWRFLQRSGVEVQSGPGRHPTSSAIFVYFSGPQNMTYEYSYGVAHVDERTWRARNFPLEEPGSIDMWGGPTRRVTSQPQANIGLPALTRG